MAKCKKIASRTVSPCLRSESIITPKELETKKCEQRCMGDVETHFNI
jgi:hypothetical protein